MGTRGRSGARGLSVERARERGRVRLAARGDLDMTTAPRFVDDVVAVLDEGVPVHVELRALTFIDSIGITALAKIAQYGGDRVSFGRATPDVQRSLDAVAAERYLRFAGDPAGRRT